MSQAATNLLHASAAEAETLARRILLAIENEARRTDANYGDLGSMNAALHSLAEAALYLGEMTDEEAERYSL